jgi:hypothetical protein
VPSAKFPIFNHTSWGVSEIRVQHLGKLGAEAWWFTIRTLPTGNCIDIRKKKLVWLAYLVRGVWAVTDWKLYKFRTIARAQRILWWKNLGHVFVKKWSCSSCYQKKTCYSIRFIKNGIAIPQRSEHNTLLEHARSPCACMHACGEFTYRRVWAE